VNLTEMEHQVTKGTKRRAHVIGLVLALHFVLTGFWIFQNEWLFACINGTCMLMTVPVIWRHLATEKKRMKQMERRKEFL